MQLDGFSTDSRGSRFRYGSCWDCESMLVSGWGIDTKVQKASTSCTRPNLLSSSTNLLILSLHALCNRYILLNWFQIYILCTALLPTSYIRLLTTKTTTSIYIQLTWSLSPHQPLPFWRLLPPCSVTPLSSSCGWMALIKDLRVLVFHQATALSKMSPLRIWSVMQALLQSLVFVQLMVRTLCGCWRSD